MNTVDRIRRLAKNYHDPNMKPQWGNLHDCLDTLDIYACITTAKVVRNGGAPAMFYNGHYRRDKPVGARVRQHERHAGFIETPYFWLGAHAEAVLSEMA